MRNASWVQDLGRDLRYGMRALAKSPVFTLLAVLALGIGSGVDTALFGIFNYVLLRDLPVEDPQQLVVVAGRVKGSSQYMDFSYPDLLDYRAQSTAAFSDMIGYLPRFSGFAVDGQAQEVFASYVSSNFFTMLGLHSRLGRLSEPQEAAGLVSSSPSAVLSYWYWQRRFNGDPSVIGKTALLDGAPVTIIGVGPPSFHGAFAFMNTDVYTPMTRVALMENCGCATTRGGGGIRVIGRLRPDASLSQARAVLQVISRRLAGQYPATNRNISSAVFPEPLARPQADAAAVWPIVMSIGMALALVVLVLACANVTNLLLVRANAREGEMAVRLALGAGRERLARQLITENLLLALLGGVLGTLLGMGASRLLSSMSRPVDFPMFRLDLDFDWRVFLFAFGITLILGLTLGLIAARGPWRSNLNLVLHEGSDTATRGRVTHRKRNALVTVQVAASTVLMIASGLFIHSLRNAERMDLGFDPKNLLNLTMDVKEAGYDVQHGIDFFPRLLDRVGTLPGVEAAAYAACVPFASGYMFSHIYVDGQATAPGESGPAAYFNEVSPDYFKTMQIQILRGRAFSDADDERAPQTAIVNQMMALRIWPGRDPIGKRFRTGPAKPWLEVVGIAANAQYVNPAPGFRSYYYLPIAQHYEASRTLQLRTSLPPATLAGEVLTEIRRLAPSLPISSVLTMDQQLHGINGLYLFDINAISSAALAVLGLLLAVIGVYGVISYATSRRIHEIGVRMALGAQRPQILQMFFLQGVRLVAVGVLTGVVLSLVLARVITNLLPFVGAADPLTFGTTVVVVTGTALLACYLPARRITRTEPMMALRHE